MVLGGVKSSAEIRSTEKRLRAEERPKFATLEIHRGQGHAMFDSTASSKCSPRSNGCVKESLTFLAASPCRLC